MPHMDSQDNKSSSIGSPVELKRLRRLKKLEPLKECLLSRIRQGISSIVLLQELRSLGYGGTLRTLQRYLKDHKVNMHTTSQQMKEWMHLVLQDAKTNIQVKQDIGSNLTCDEVVTLMKCIKTKPIKLRNRALTLLAHANGIRQDSLHLFFA